MNYQKGNYILTEHGELPIKHVSFESYLVTGKDGRTLWANKIEPIEITSERLIKIGFKQKSGNEYVNDIFTYRISQKNLVINGYEYDYNGIIINPKYIHQIQNIITVLTEDV